MLPVANMFTQKLMANNEQCIAACSPVFANKVLFCEKMVCSLWPVYEQCATGLRCKKISKTGPLHFRKHAISSAQTLLTLLSKQCHWMVCEFLSGWNILSYNWEQKPILPDPVNVATLHKLPNLHCFY